MRPADTFFLKRIRFLCFIIFCPGHSLAVDPWGKVVADAGGYDGPGTTTNDEDEGSTTIINTPSIILCDIDMEQLKSTRERMPIQQHRDNAKF